MRPAFRIYADSVEITEAVKDRLLEMVVIDEAGLQSDELRLTLDDRRRDDGAVAELPQIGTVLKAYMGYQETSLVEMGTYIVDEIELRSPPATMCVSAKAADMPSKFRSPKTKSWHDTTIGDIVSTIAADHGYTPCVDPDLAGIAIHHIDQTQESDMSFLTRLASQHDAVAKPMDGKIVFAKTGSGKSVSGKNLPTITLSPTDLCQWSYKRSARKPGGQDETKEAPKKGGTRAFWWDYAAGKRQVVEVGDPPYEEIKYIHATEKEARDAATKRKKQGDRREAELSFSLPGDPGIAAESRLVVDLRPGIQAKWRIKHVEHRLGTNGYTCQVECEKFV